MESSRRLTEGIHYDFRDVDSEEAENEIKHFLENNVKQDENQEQQNLLRPLGPALRERQMILQNMLSEPPHFSAQENQDNEQNPEHSENFRVDAANVHRKENQRNHCKPESKFLVHKIHFFESHSPSFLVAFARCETLFFPSSGMSTSALENPSGTKSFS